LPSILAGSSSSEAYADGVARSPDYSPVPSAST
jgi:hypothetical protein